MKRKRGYAKCKPKKSSVVGAKEAIQNDAALVADYDLEDLVSEDAAMDDEAPQVETNTGGPALEKLVDDEGMEDNVNSLGNTNIAVLGNLSKLAGSIATKLSRGNDAHAKFNSGMETETRRDEINMSGLQVDLEKGAANGRVENYPNSLREMIISIISDMSKEAGGITTYISRTSVDNPISNAPMFQSQVDRTHQEKSSLLHQDPRYKEEELSAALSVIKKTMKMDVAAPFNVPVDPIALGIPDYFDVIDTPMDFGTICNHLENGLKYMNSGDVFKDVQYIWENCRKYNKKGDYILEIMKRAKKNFMKYWIAAGLQREQQQAVDESTMTVSKHRGECPVGPNQVQIHQQSLIPSQAYQPHQNSNQPSPQQADVSTSTTGYSHLQLPAEAAMWHSMQRQECLVSTATGQIDQNQAHSRRPSIINNQPQQSLKYTNVSTGAAECSHLPSPSKSIMRRSKRGKDCPVSPVTENPAQLQQNKVVSNQVQDNRPSLIDIQANQPQLSSNRQQSSPREGDANIDSASIQKKPRGRGPTRCLKLLTTVGRIVVATNNLGQPIGLETSKLTSFLGLVARDGNLAPLSYPSWGKMPAENKEIMWQKVLSKFDIDPKSKRWVLVSLGTKWRNFKSHLKVNHYDIHATDAERLADCDERVLPDQWSALVSQWSSEKWQNISAINKANRARMKFCHATGKKSFARVREEERAKRADGKEPSRAELFILTRTCKNGKPVNEATAAVISQLRECTAQQEETLEKKSKPQDDIYSQVMGQDRKGGVCLYGLGVTHSQLGDQTPTRSDALRMVSEAKSEVYEMKEKLESMEHTCTQMASQMATLMSMVASMHKSSPDNHVSNVEASTFKPSGGLPLLPGHSSTSHHAGPSRQTRGRKRR